MSKNRVPPPMVFGPDVVDMLGIGVLPAPAQHVYIDTTPPPAVNAPDPPVSDNKPVVDVVQDVVDIVASKPPDSPTEYKIQTSVDIQLTPADIDRIATKAGYRKDIPINITRDVQCDISFNLPHGIICFPDTAATREEFGIEDDRFNIAYGRNIPSYTGGNAMFKFANSAKGLRFAAYKPFLLAKDYSATYNKTTDTFDTVIRGAAGISLNKFQHKIPFLKFSVRTETNWGTFTRFVWSEDHESEIANIKREYEAKIQERDSNYRKLYTEARAQEAKNTMLKAQVTDSDNALQAKHDEYLELLDEKERLEAHLAEHKQEIEELRFKLGEQPKKSWLHKIFN